MGGKELSQHIIHLLKLILKRYHVHIKAHTLIYIEYVCHVCQVKLTSTQTFTESY